MEKKVDENWKEKVEKENKDKIEQPDVKANNEMPPVNFVLFMTSLGMQALMSLAEIENPVTNKKEKDLTQAKYLIDTIGMLEEKTRGNLDEEESKVIEQLLYELRIKYVTNSK